MASLMNIYPGEEYEMAQLDEMSRAIGRIEQSLDNIKIQLSSGVSRFSGIETRLEKIEAVESERKGMMKLAHLLYVGLGAIGAAIMAKLSAMLGIPG